MGKQGRQKFAYVWANKPILGKQFGLSAMAMGKRLKELGLRGEDGNPTAQALGQGYCTPTPLKDGTPFYMWNRQQVEELAALAGAETRASDAAQGLAERLIAWIQNSDWAASEAYLRDHAAELLTDEAEAALELLRQGNPNHPAISQHQTLLRRCREMGIAAAYE